MPIRKTERKLYIPPRIEYNDNIIKHTISGSLKSDKAEYIMSNANIKRIDVILFKFLDIVNPFINKHPKIGSKIVYVFEKIMKCKNNNLSNILK